MGRMVVIILAASLTVCHGSSIETSTNNAQKNEAVISVTPESLFNNTTLPLANKTVPLNSEADNANVKTQMQRKAEQKLSENWNSTVGLGGNSKENKNISKRNSSIESSSEKDKVSLASPFLPFLPLVERKDNPLLQIFHNFADKKQDKAELEDSSQKKMNEKPFLFFDFFFDIREIPLLNASSSNLTKPTKSETMNINFKNSVPEESSDKKWLKRSAPEGESFLDDSKLFHPLGLEEFLPKPDFFFFPDSFFHRPANKRSAIKKRDEKTKTLRFVDEKRNILWRKKRTGQKQDTLRSLTEKIKKGAREIELDLKKKENPELLMSKAVKIGELHPMHSSNKEKRENEKKVEVQENAKNSQKDLKLKDKTPVKDEKKQGLN